jgi:hypothetical protein
MNYDVDNTKNVIAIKQKLKDSLNNNFFKYLNNKIKKNVDDCNYLYTQVCYLIKLFLLYEFEQNIDINYNLDELFIRFCFKLIKNNNPDYILLESEKKDNIKIRLLNFYKEFNTQNIPFTCPSDLDSISHITNSLSRDITTNIKNNIIINFYKYIKEFIKINIKLEFENNNFIVTKEIIKDIFYDIINNTLFSDSIFHEWIIKNKKLIIPDFNNDIIYIDSIKNGMLNHPKLLKNFIIKYIKEDEILNKICILNNIKNNIK